MDARSMKKYKRADEDFDRFRKSNNPRDFFLALYKKQYSILTSKIKEEEKEHRDYRYFMAFQNLHFYTSLCGLSYSEYEVFVNQAVTQGYIEVRNCSMGYGYQLPEK